MRHARQGCNTVVQITKNRYCTSDERKVNRAGRAVQPQPQESPTALWLPAAVALATDDFEFAAHRLIDKGLARGGFDGYIAEAAVARRADCDA